MDDAKREETRRQAEAILGPKSKDQMKRRISEMFDTLREMKSKNDPGAAEFAEKLQIWDDVYHELKSWNF